MSNVVGRLRGAVQKLRRTPMQISDVAPMLHEAADLIESLAAENKVLRAKTFTMTQAIMDAYGILWNINTEPMTPIPLVDPERAAAKARLILKEMLCHEQIGIAINAARAALAKEATK